MYHGGKVVRALRASTTRGLQHPLPAALCPAVNRGARDRASTDEPGRVPGADEERFHVQNMYVYEAKIEYNKIGTSCHETLDTPQKILDYMAGAFDDSPLQEHFYVVCLNRKNRPICWHRISSGTITASMTHPREVFRTAVLATACAIICIHNHPSGDPQPSQQDITMTRRLKEAATIMDIELVDHIVMGSVEDDPNGTGYFSFREKGYV